MTTNVEDVLISVDHQVDSLCQITPNPCIRKVPEFMASVPIEPLVVSIGPLYYDKEALKPLHEMKLRYLQSLRQFADEDFDLGQYIDIIKEKEDEIRSYYSEKSSLSSNEFIEMILIDAAFVIFYFIINSKQDPIANRMEVVHMVDHDLFLVENQLPFFVLCDLFDKAFRGRYSNYTFKDIAYFYMRDSLLLGSEVVDTIEVREELRDTDIVHLVDCLRICWLPTKRRCGYLSLDTKLACKFHKTAKELKKIGVKFVAYENKRLLDITFSKGVLQIPKLKIEDTTKAILRSMAFYEQCHLNDDSYIIDYLFFMDALIDTPEDVQILVHNGIIKSWLGSNEEVATLFNDVSKHVPIDIHNFYYAHIYHELDAYANIKWNHWKAVLKRDYFNHPWSVISFIYLVVLLILTALQVYTSFKE